MHSGSVVLSPWTLRRAVWRINANCAYRERQQTNEAVHKMIKKVSEAAENGSYDFRDFSKVDREVNGKSRSINRFWGWQTENVISVYLKLVLDRNMALKYPNRRNVIKRLFNQLYLLKDFRNYTILRFDFKDFFESLSTGYIFRKFVQDSIKDRNDIKLFQAYCKEIRHCHVGLPLSNAFAEIAGRAFDSAMRETFSNNGLTFYTRYVDDCIMILSERVTKSECLTKIHKCLENVFGDSSIPDNEKNTVAVHQDGKKFQYFIDSDVPKKTSFDFLGYEVFFLNNNNSLLLQYGITKEKRDKYEAKIEEMVKQCADLKYCEILRHRIQTFCRRVVYRKKEGKSLKWNVKGFISDYSELRYHLSNGDIHADTENFLKNIIADVCKRKFTKLPYFLKTDNKDIPHPAYTLYDNMEKNRTLLFDPDFQLGISRDALIKRLKQIDKVVAIEESEPYASILHKYLGELWVSTQ